MTTPQNGVRRVWLNAGTASEFFPASARMFFQSAVDCDVYGSNNPSAGSELVGSVVAGTASAIETGYAYISLSSSASGDCSISYVSAGAAATGGGGGGGGGGAVTIADGADITQGARNQTAATDDTGAWSLVQLTKRGLQRISTILDRLPALVSGRMPVDPTGAVQTGSGAVTATTQRVTLATDGPGVVNLTSIDGKLPASLGGKAAAASLSVTAAVGTITSIGGTVTTGGAAQQLAAANAARRGLTVQNTSAGELRVNVFGTASASAGYRVMAGELLVLDAPHCGVGAVSIWGATTGQAFIGGEAV